MIPWGLSNLYLVGVRWWLLKRDVGSIRAFEETLENFFTKEIERNETCRFDMNEYSILHDHLQLRQLCWDFSARFPYISQQNSKIWLWFGTLIACGIFQSFTFLVLESSVCKDIEEIEYMDGRHCSLEEGAGIIFVSCFCW